MMKMRMRGFLALAVLAGMAFTLANPVMADADNDISTTPIDLASNIDLNASDGSEATDASVATAPADPVPVTTELTDGDLSAPAFGADNLQVSTNGAAAADTAANSTFVPATASAGLYATETANAASRTPSSEVGGPGSSGYSLGAPAPNLDERLSLVT